VVVPILRHLRLEPRLYAIVQQESVVLEPIGVLLALLSLEWLTVSGAGGEEAVLEPLALLVVRVATGFVVGVVGGWLIARVARLRVVPRSLLGPVVMIAALGLYVLGELVLEHAGLPAVIVAGVVFTRRKHRHHRSIESFAVRLAEIAVALLFLLLAADLDPAGFALLGPLGLLTVAAIVFVVRPLAVLASTWRTPLSWGERAFLAWLAPRGVVTAAFAALCAERAVAAGHPLAALVEPLIFTLVGVTVVLHGLTARPVAWLLGVTEPSREGWLVAGARGAGRRVARLLGEAGVTAVLVDTDARAVREAAAEGLTALHVDSLDARHLHRPELEPVGHLLSVMEEAVLDAAVVHEWAEVRPSGTAVTWDESVDVDGSISGAVRAAAVATALAYGEARMRVVPPGEPASTGALALLAVRDGKARALATSRAHRGETQIVIEPRVPREDRFFRAVDRLDAPELGTACYRLLKLASARLPSLDPDTTMAKLMDRERRAPMGVSVVEGAILAHVKTDAVPVPECFVGILAHPIRDIAGAPVRVVFLLLSPPDRPELHLRALARIAERSREPELVPRLIATHDALALLDLLEGEDVSAGAPPDGGPPSAVRRPGSRVSWSP
jgi:NhaP-type Na+/H+ or K+/H+ antiporter/mannitol/fructose-specific phosphotransferase system IIA component (Ntr-type)